MECLYTRPDGHFAPCRYLLPKTNIPYHRKLQFFKNIHCYEYTRIWTIFKYSSRSFSHRNTEYEIRHSHGAYGLEELCDVSSSSLVHTNPEDDSSGLQGINTQEHSLHHCPRCEHLKSHIIYRVFKLRRREDARKREKAYTISALTPALSSVT